MVRESEWFEKWMDAQTKKLDVLRVSIYKEQGNRDKEYNNWNEKNKLEGINSRLNNSKEWINELEDRVRTVNRKKEKRKNNENKWGQFKRNMR